MLGDLDLIHMARDHCAPAVDLPIGETHSLGRISLDSSYSATTCTTPGSLSSSWGPGSPKFGAFLTRQSSLPVSSVSAPMNIPGSRAPRASDGGGGGILRRSSLNLTGSFAFAAVGSAERDETTRCALGCRAALLLGPGPLNIWRACTHIIAAPINPTPRKVFAPPVAPAVANAGRLKATHSALPHSRIPATPL